MCLRIWVLWARAIASLMICELTSYSPWLITSGVRSHLYFISPVVKFPVTSIGILTIDIQTDFEDVENNNSSDQWIEKNCG
ncbi:MAG: hypothetical protein V7K41_31230 [Nostoc sp.]|uniref:hypothetical protein n=1 Tax=Nostoc sp. TaxID=1180 RepID=UPI002FF9EB82